MKANANTLLEALAQPLRAQAVTADGVMIPDEIRWTGPDGEWLPLMPESLRPREQCPWFWSCSPESPQHRKDYVAAKNAAFDGVRWNDLHYTCAAKQAARTRKQEPR